MRKILGLSILLMCAVATSNVDAQEEKGLFSGNGMKGIWSGEGATGPKTAGTFGFYNSGSATTNTPAEKPGFQFPKFEMPKLNLPKLQMPRLFEQGAGPSQFADSTRNLFSGLKLPTRDPNQPSFFQRMNDRTRELFGRTRQGINDTTNHVLGADQSARQTWDTITKGLSGDIGGSGNRNQPPIQPNFRSARQPAGSTSKF